MASTTELDPTEDGSVVPLRSEQRNSVISTLTAAARRLTETIAKRVGGKAVNTANSLGWEEDAWDMYDLVGEQRFLANAIAGRMAQARLYVGKVSDDPTQPPVPLSPVLAEGEPVPEDYTPPSETDLKAAAALEAFGDTAQGRAQLIERMGVNLFMVGKGWYVGIPKDLLNAALAGNQVTGPTPVNTEDIIPVADASEVSVDDLVWKMLSVSEVKIDGDIAQLSFDDAEPKEFKLNQILLIKIWRSHPRWAWQADSPVRSSLPVLRELVGLTMHISAQIDSRLTGAGVFLIPQGARDAFKRQTGNPNTGTSDDPFADAVLESMVTAISNRSSAEALAPIMLTVPDETVEKFKHITFSTPLDKEARPLREETIRRVALGEDAPPELLLGTGNMNHWGAWLGQEDVVKNHVTPPLALVCDGLTTEYLWGVLIQQGIDEKEAQDYVFWYDVEHLITRPNRSADAKDAFAAGAINQEAYRDAIGFDDTAAPGEQSALELALEMVRGTPGLAKIPGIPSLVQQIQAVLDGTPDAAPEMPVEQPSSVPVPGAPGSESPAGKMPDTSADPGGPDSMAASGLVLWAEDPDTGAIERHTEFRTGNGGRTPDVYVTTPPQEAPQVTINLPEGMVKMNVEPTPVHITNDVQVDPTPITVQPATAPIIVEPSTAQVNVDVSPTPVTVQSPTVNVEAPQVTVEAAQAPDVTVNVPESQVTVNVPEAPAPEVTVNVPAPEVTVNVEAPPAPEPKTAKVIRNDKGLISGVEYDD